MFESFVNCQCIDYVKKYNSFLVKFVIIFKLYQDLDYVNIKVIIYYRNFNIQLFFFLYMMVIIGI